MAQQETSQETDSGTDEGRRESLGWLGRVGLAAGLTAAYGTLAAYMGRFLFPARPPAKGWLFVAQTDRISSGEALLYRTPAGRTVNITRRGDGRREDGRQGGAAGAEKGRFLALSSTCPHLGCQVHWQPQNDRFFCPCHNGVFTPEGQAIGGPPGRGRAVAAAIRAEGGRRAAVHRGRASTSSPWARARCSRDRPPRPPDPATIRVSTVLWICRSANRRGESDESEPVHGPAVRRRRLVSGPPAHRARQLSRS